MEQDEEFQNWHEDDKESAWKHYFSLVNTLHNNSDLIPKKLLNLINEDMYAHFEP